MAVGPLEHRDQVGEARFLGRPAGQGVLEDLELGAGGPQRAAQLGELADLQPAVLREHCGVGARELLADLLDDRHLLGPGHGAPLNDEVTGRRVRGTPRQCSGRSPRPAGLGPITAPPVGARRPEVCGADSVVTVVSG